MGELMECPFCAEEISINAKKCKHCLEYLDQEFANKSLNIQIDEKKKLPALILCWTLGFMGAHRFYAGKKQHGKISLILGSIITITFIILEISNERIYKYNGGFPYTTNSISDYTTYLTILGIGASALALWAFIDFINIIRGAFTDENGKKLDKWT